MPTRARTLRSPRCLFALLALLALIGCGGAAKSDALVAQTLTVGPVTGFSGFIEEITIGSAYDVMTAVPITAGDDTANNQTKGFIRFDLSTIPAGATIVSATMTVTQVAPAGSPYANLGGNLQVDHVNTGAALDGADFNGNSLALNFGTISTDAVLEQKTLSVGAQVALDLAQGRTTSDFRLAFVSPTNNDGNDDLAMFVQANFAGGPTLELNLLVPAP